METKASKRTCFVIGPIGSRSSETRKGADFLLKGIIRPAIEVSLNLQIWRADEDSNPGMITDKLISDIYESDLVIADLSELNANVFYELGIRHAASRPAIHVAAEGTKLPFDNIGYRAITFDRSDWESIEGAKTQLAQQAEAALSTGFQVSNPVTQALSAKAFRASAEPTEKVLAELMERMSRIEQNTTRSPTPKSFRAEADFRDARDILIDVAIRTKHEMEEPYFKQAVEDIIINHGYEKIRFLYDSNKIAEIGKILKETYIPF